MRKRSGTPQLWLHILAVAIILICNLWNLNKLYSPQCVPDEIGYLANAAYLTGLDWSGLMRVSPYYSAGYSLLLAPVFLLFKSGVMIYRAGVVINAFLLVLCYFIICYIAGVLFPTVHDIKRQLCALAVTLYSFNVFSSQCTQSEVLLVTMQWGLTVLIISISRSPKVWKMILLALCTVYSFAIHMRTIGIAISVCVVVFLLLLTKVIKPVHIGVFGVITALGLFCVTQFNDWLFSSLYGGGVVTNSVGGQIDHIKEILSLQGMGELIVLALGRFFNLGAATFLLFYIGFFSITVEIVYACKAVVTKKQKQFSPLVIPKIFFWLNIMAAIGISSISMEGASLYNRIDAFLYGRYNEYCAGPVLLYGVLMLFVLRKTKKRDDVAALAVFQILLATVLYLYFRAYNISGSSTYSIGSVYSFPFEEMSSNYQIKYTFMLAVWSILVYALLRLLCWKWLQTGAIVGVGALWVTAGLKSADMLYYSQSAKCNKWNDYAQDIKQLVGESPVYYYYNASGESPYYNIFQAKVFFSDVDIQAAMIPITEEQEEEKEQIVNQILQDPPEFILYRDGVQGLEELFEQNLYVPYYTQTKDGLPWILYINLDLYNDNNNTDIGEVMPWIHLNLADQLLSSGNQIQQKQNDGSWKAIYTKGVDGAERLEDLGESEISIVTNAGNNLVEEKRQQELLEKKQQVAEGILTEEDIEQWTEPLNLGEAQYSVFGPTMTLQSGSYRVAFTIECLNADQCSDDLLGKCDVSINNGQDILNTFDLTKDVLAGEEAKTCILDFSSATDNALSGIEFRVYTNTDVQFRITDISYQYVGPQTKVFLPNTEDFQTVCNLVSSDSEYLPLYIAVKDCEQNYIDYTDLNNTLSSHGHTVSLVGLNELSNVTGSAFFLIPADETESIQSLLPNYTILARLQSYALLAPSSSDVCNKFRDNGGRVLSNGNAISLRYYAGAVSNAASSTQATLPAGQYRLDYEVQIAGASVFDSCGTLVISYSDQKNEIPLTKDLFVYDVYRGSLSENVVLEENTKISAQVSTIPEVSGAQLDVWITPIS